MIGIFHFGGIEPGMIKNIYRRICMTKIYRVIGLIFALGLFSGMVFAESDSYIDAVYAFSRI